MSDLLTPEQQAALEQGVVEAITTGERVVLPFGATIVPAIAPCEARNVYGPYTSEPSAPPRKPDAGFLEAIIAAPEDDTPRLIYADWLEEHGQDARAEFIRVQIEIAKLILRSVELPGGAWSHEVRNADRDKYDGLRQRERELLDVIGKREACALPMPMYGWTVDPDGSNHPGLPRIVFRRGFVEHVVCYWDTFEENVDTLLAAHPVSEVKLLDWPRPDVFYPIRLGQRVVELKMKHGKKEHVKTFGLEDMDAAGVSVDLRTEFIVETLSSFWPQIAFTLPE